MGLLLIVLVPTFWEPATRVFHPLKIDTDPENMLAQDEPVRVFHNEMKKRFALHDFIVVGIVNKDREEGVFSKNSLTDIYALEQTASEIQWDGTDGSKHGVVRSDIIAPSFVDNIEQAGLGEVKFEWLMAQPPEDDAAAQDIGKKAKRIPLFNNTLVSEDGTAIALYLPIYDKADSYPVAQILREKIATFENGDTYHITGLPIAQDQFGIEMFVQMAISAPLAMMLIFGLMWYFFRNVKVIMAPMIVAMGSVMITMGLLVATGNTVHIMSSMIPIFIMPIAVLDAVHVLSEFYDRHNKKQDTYETLKQTMVALWRPMLFTSLTTAIGFVSLALADIPPIKVFGIFVAIGVLLAWFLTMTLVPAYIMSLSPKTLEKFGGDVKKSHLVSFLPVLGRLSFGSAKLILWITLALYGVGMYGISQIRVNDNPVKWFEKSHDIRVADRALNESFGGTYMAYVALDATEAGATTVSEDDLKELDQSVLSELIPQLDKGVNALLELTTSRRDLSETDEAYAAWNTALLTIDRITQRAEVFKRPDVLHWIEDLQAYFLATGLVGKSNALPDIVKTVHRELQLGNDEAFRIPNSSEAVAQTLLTFQSSHRAQDLWHFVTADYQHGAIWLQLTSGDNKDMQTVADAMETYVAQNPPPIELEHNWFGLTYVNSVWQQKMVTGMLVAFAGSFVTVLLMLIVLFRSIIWGVLSMIPLTMSIGLIYGLIGIVGKEYDMPIAVLSSLSLGLAVDYAIHFMARSREIRARHTTWREALDEVFGEPARAIFRNIVIVGVGFTPLILAPLGPYQTVGYFISLILLISGFASLAVLPALITLFQNWMFKSERQN